MATAFDSTDTDKEMQRKTVKVLTEDHLSDRYYSHITVAFKSFSGSGWHAPRTSLGEITLDGVKHTTFLGRNQECPKKASSTYCSLKLKLTSLESGPKA